MQKLSVWEDLADMSLVYGAYFFLMVIKHSSRPIVDAQSGRAGKELYLYNPLLGMSILVLNSFEAAQDLLVHRAAIYSDRPPSTMLELYYSPSFKYICAWATGSLTPRQIIQIRR
jgi:hypothetical protein